MNCKKCKNELSKIGFVTSTYTYMEIGVVPGGREVGPAIREIVYYCTNEKCEHYSLLKILIEKTEL